MLSRRQFLIYAGAAILTSLGTGSSGVAFSSAINSSGTISPALPDLRGLISIFREIEDEYYIPKYILQAIAHVESGKTGRNGQVTPWPWTLNVAGEGKYFQNRGKTLVYLRQVLKKTRMIDIGCMQINYRWHGQNFVSLEDMLNPTTNIRYAAGYLRENLDRYGNWTEAVSHYHSSMRRHQDNYVCKVLAAYLSLSRRVPIDHGNCLEIL